MNALLEKFNAMILFPIYQTKSLYESEESPQWYHEGHQGTPISRGNNNNIFRAVNFSIIIQFNRIHLFSMQLEFWPYICDRENATLSFWINPDPRYE